MKTSTASSTANTRTRALKSLLKAAAVALTLAPAALTAADSADLSTAFTGDATATENAALKAAIKAYAAATDSADAAEKHDAFLDALDTAKNAGVLPTTPISTDSILAARVTVGSGTAGSVHLDDGVTLAITGNTGATYGGAFNFAFNSLGVFTAADTASYSFSGNSATYGGAIYNNGDSYNAGNRSTLSLLNATFIENTAGYGGGGAIFNNYSTLDIAKATFTRNRASSGGSGGAIYNNYGTVTITNSTFTDNSVVGQGGGAIFNYYDGILNIRETSFTGNSTTNSQGGGAVFNFNKTTIANATFTNNSANGSGGGAIFNVGSATLSITDATFTNNSANGQGGGAIFNSASAILNITNATFTENIVVNSNAQGGGAISSAPYATLTLENVSFLRNSISAGNSNAGGGAIFSDYGVQLTFNVTGTNTATFSGNTDKGASGTATTPNSLTIAKSTVVINTAPDAVLDMRDPMRSVQGGYTTTITKNGEGTWKLGGENILGIVSNSINATITVSDGTLHLYRAGEVANATTTDPTATAGFNAKVGAASLYLGTSFSGTNSAFTLAAPATLSIGGGNTITAHTITLAAGSTLAFELADIAPHISPSSPFLTLVATGGTITPEDHTIRFFSYAAAPGTYTLLAGVDLSSKALVLEFDPAATLSGEAISGTRARDGGTLYTLDANTTPGHLLLNYTPVSAVVTWANSAAATDAWNITDANFTGINAAAETVTQFLHGDVVNFVNDVDTTTATIALNPDGNGIIHTAGILFSGTGSYTFTGESLHAAPNTTLSYAQGAFILGANAALNGSSVSSPPAPFSGTIDLTGTGANFFESVALYGGTLRISAAAQLGNTLSHLNLSGNANAANATAGDAATPVLRIAAGSTVTFSAPGDTSQRLNVNVQKSAVIHAETGATLVIEGNTISGSGGAIYVANGAKLDLTGGGSFIFRNNSAIGASAFGGAIYGFRGTMTIEKSEFIGNTAKIGAAICNDLGSVTITNSNFIQNSSEVGGALAVSSGMFTITDSNFFRNSATNGSGGAIYGNYYTLNLNVTTGQTSTFSGNTDSDHGANAITFSSISPTINVAAAATLDMRDPVVVQSGTITKTGTGTWKLGGTSTFTSSNLNVTGGTLYLYRAGEVANATTTDPTDTAGFNARVTAATITAASSGTFTLGASATLAASGGNSITFNTITLAAGSTLAFNLADTAPDLTDSGDASRAFLTLNATGGTITPQAHTIRLLSGVSTPGTYTLLSGVNLSGQTLSLAFDSNARFFGELPVGTRANDIRPGVYSLDATTSLLLLHYTPANAVVTWTNTAGTDAWNITDANFAGIDTLGSSVTQFLHGDVVNFDNNTTATIALNPAGDHTIHTAGILFSGTGSYTFTGGTLSATATTFTGTTGALVLGANATLSSSTVSTTSDAFSGTVDLTATGANSFAFVQLNGGTLRISDAEQLGTTLANLKFSGDATATGNTPGDAVTPVLRIAEDSTVTFSASGDASQRIVLVTNTSAILHAEIGATFTIEGNSNATNGGAIYLNSGSKLDLIGDGSFIFRDNKVKYLGGAIYSNNDTLTLQNTDFLRNSAVEAGGAIYNSKGTVALNNVTFIENSTSTSGGSGLGGAIYNFIGTVTLNGADFTDNIGNFGGAIYNEGTVVLRDAEFTSNSAGNFGGAILNNEGALTLTNANFTRNSALSGGAIYNNAATLNINVTASHSSTFSGNTDSIGANSITLSGDNTLAIVTETDAVLDVRDPLRATTATGTNTITKTGVGTWKLGGSNALGNSLANTALTVSEGTLYLYRAGEVANPTTSDPDARVSAATINLGTASASAFTLAAPATLAVSGGNSITAQTITLAAGSTLAFNLADTAPDLTDSGDASRAFLTLNATGGTITPQAHTIRLLSGVSTPGTYTLLSGVDLSAQPLTLTVDPNAALLGERLAGTRGNAYTLVAGTALLLLNYAPASAVVTWTNADAIGDWNITDHNFTGTETLGGPVNQFLHGDVVNFRNIAATAATTTATITVNSGGEHTVHTAGILFSGTGSYTFTGGTLHAAANATLTGSTGALVLGANATLSGSTVSTTSDAFSGTVDLTATGANSFSFVQLNGGTLRISDAEQLGTTLANLKFSGDATATGNTPGDVVTPVLSIATGTTVTFTASGYASQSIALVTNTSAILHAEIGATFTIEGNSHAANGGAIYLDDGSKLDLTGDGSFFFSGNTADFGGGAISGYNDILTLQNADFLGNIAVEFGGAIFNNLGTVTLSDVTFTENTSTSGSSGSGGAIYNIAGAVTLRDAEFTRNSANYGGAIYNDYDSNYVNTIALRNAVFSGNTAAYYGGAIYNAKGTLSLSHTDFSDNKITEVNYYGGAIYNAGTLALRYADLIRNSADYGGAIYNYFGTVRLREADFTSNSASFGGAIFNDTGTVTLRNTDFSLNSASYYGGAIYGYKGTVTLRGSNFTQNTASTSGGAIYNNEGALTLTNANFTRNSALFGGAIYNDAATLNINVTAGHSSTFSGNTDSTGANSITLLGDNTLAIFTETDAVLDVRDPLRALSGSSTITITKTGEGIWKLGGSNILNDGGSATTLTVSEGTLHLYRDDEVANPTSTVEGTGGFDAKVGVATLALGSLSGQFTLGANATLSVGGGNSISAKFITFTAGSTLSFDLTNVNKTSALLTLDTAELLSGQAVGAGTVNLYNAGTLSILETGHYLLADVGVANIVAITGTLTVNGLPAEDVIRAGGIPAFQLYKNGDAHLLGLALLSAETLEESVEDLVWDGTNVANGNIWKNDAGTRLAPNWAGQITVTDITVGLQTFLNQDSVIFNNNAENKNVLVHEDGVTTTNVLFENDELNPYTFGGDGSVTTTNLSKTGGGDVTFNNAVTLEGVLDVSGGGTLALLGAGSSLAGNVAVTESTLVLNAVTLADTAAVVLDQATLQLDGDSSFGGTLELHNADTIAVSGSVALTGGLTGTGSTTFTKSGAGTLSFGAAEISGFSGILDIAQGAVNYSGDTLENALTGNGTLAVTATSAATAFNFGANVGTVFSGEVVLKKGTIHLTDGGANLALLQGAGLTVESAATAHVVGDETLHIQSLVLGGGTLKFDSAGEGHELSPPPLLHVASLSSTALSTVEVAIQGIDTTAPVLGEVFNFFTLPTVASNYQYRLIAADSATALTASHVSVKPIDDSAQQRRELADGTGAVFFDYTASVLTTGDAQGLYLGYGLTGISANEGRFVTLDATGVVDASLAVQLSGEGGFHITGDGETVALGNAGSDYKGDTVVSNVVLNVATATALGDVAGLKLTDGAVLNAGGVAEGFAFTTLNLGADTALNVAALTVTTGGSVNGAVSVSGAAVVADSAVISGNSDWSVGSLNNRGTLVLASLESSGGAVLAGVANSGLLKVTGTTEIEANLTNSGDFVATDADIAGSVLNEAGGSVRVGAVLGAAGVVNAGDFIATGAIVGGVVNASGGTARVADVLGAAGVENFGNFIGGAISGNVANAGTGAVASVATVEGAVANSGVFIASGSVGSVTANNGNVTVGSVGGNVANAGVFTSAGDVGGNLSNATGGTVRVADVLGEEGVLNAGDFSGGSINGSVANSGNLTATTVRSDFANVGADAVASVASVGGDVANAGAFIASGAVGSVSANSGNVTVGSVGGAVANAGVFVADGAVGSMTANSGSVTVGSVGGDVANAGEFVASGAVGSVSANTGSVTVGSVGGAVANAGVFFANGAVGSVSANSGSVTVGSVGGDVANAGEFVASGAVGSVSANTGSVTVGSVGGAVANAGEFTTTGTIGGNFVNTGTGAVATLRDVRGSVSNRGNVIYLSGDASWGALDNSNGLVDFAGDGRVLRVASLAADTGTAGNFALSVNLVDGTASNRVIVDGAITGQHNFTLSLAADVDVNAVTAESGNFAYIALDAGQHGNEVIGGVLRNVGLYDFTLIWDAGQGGYVLRAETEHYSASAQAALNSAGAAPSTWFTQLDNLTKRFGDLRLAGPEAKALTNAFWVRASAQRVNADLGIAGVGGFHENQYGADVGYDRVVSGSADTDSQVLAGAFVAFQSTHRNFSGGKGSTESVAAGAYATWLHKDGWFADGVVKGQYFDSEYDVSAIHGAFDNYGIGASLELGRQFSIGNGFFLEPGLQFSYAHLAGDDYVASDGLRVDVGDSDLFRVAAGLRAGWTLDLVERGRISPYVKVGVEEQFSSGGKVRAAGERWSADVDGTRGNVGVGVSWTLGTGTVSQSLHFEYEASHGDSYEKPWGLNAGYRVRF